MARDRQTEARMRLPGTAAVAVHFALVALAQAAPGDPRMPAEQARELRNPVPYSAAVARDGRKTYLRLCQYCHGADGRAQANPDFEAPSLRDPRDWRFGRSDGEVFVSIRDGAGHDMPPFGKQLTNEQVWQLVHYLRSIGPTDLRPVPATE